MTHTYAGNLGMGDVISHPEDDTRCTVMWVDHSIDGRTVHVRLKDHTRRVTVMWLYASVLVYETAPRCAHGDRFEHCNRECAWPMEMDALHAG